MVLKPQTYMNLSGDALLALRNVPDFDPARHLLILVDDAALPLGTFRLRARGSSGGHNGLESVEQALESRDYPRLRIGIGPVPEGVRDLAEFVLGPFIPEETAVLRNLIPSMAEAVDCWMTEGIETAMNRYNRRAGDPTEDADDEQPA
jgi:PTH1 family peptidyl-tRNA hydrolase